MQNSHLLVLGLAYLHRWWLPFRLRSIEDEGALQRLVTGAVRIGYRAFYGRLGSHLSNYGTNFQRKSTWMDTKRSCCSHLCKLHGNVSLCMASYQLDFPWSSDITSSTWIILTQIFKRTLPSLVGCDLRPFTQKWIFTPRDEWIR